MEDEDGVEAPHPSHPAKELWPYWPGGLQDQWDIDLTDSTKECDTGAAAASPELLSSCVERCHAEVLQRLDKQDEVLRRIHITLLKQPTARALNTDINCKLPEMHDSGEFGQLDITNSLILGEEKVKVCTPEVFHTFTEAGLVLRERAAEVDGDLSRQLYASAASTQGTLDRTRKERLQLWFRNLVNSPAFDMFFAFVVLTNSVFLGIEVELGMHTDEQPFALEVVQLIYAGLFTAELAMRVGAFGLGYFCGSDWMWAWLDFGIVLISLVEIFVDFLDKVRTGGEVDSNAVGSFTGFKALRLIRITRLLKTLRVVRIFRFVMALRTLVTSIVYTLRSLFWALTLLLLIVYVFSVLITQAVDPYLRENPLVSLPDEELEMARAHLNSLTQTMLSLFMSISGGLNWVDLAGPLQAISTFWVFVLLFYVSFTYFAVLNVVTGVFCQSAIDSAQNDHANIVHAMLANKEAHIDKIRSLFSQLGADKTGVITYAMFEEGINSPATCEYFESLGLDVWDAWSFFKLLDLDKGGAVEIEEFFKGCLRLRGQARGVDVGKILHDQTWLIKNTGHFQAYMEVKMKQLTEMMSQFTGLSVDNSWSRQISA